MKFAVLFDERVNLWQGKEDKIRPAISLSSRLDDW